MNLPVIHITKLTIVASKRIILRSPAFIKTLYKMRRPNTKPILDNFDWLGVWISKIDVLSILIASTTQMTRHVRIPIEASKNNGSENIYYPPELK
jgi:hypothetical protein